MFLWHGGSCFHGMVVQICCFHGMVVLTSCSQALLIIMVGVSYGCNVLKHSCISP